MSVEKPTNGGRHRPDLEVARQNSQEPAFQRPPVGRGAGPSALAVVEPQDDASRQRGRLLLRGPLPVKRDSVPVVLKLGRELPLGCELLIQEATRDFLPI